MNAQRAMKGHLSILISTTVLSVFFAHLAPLWAWPAGSPDPTGLSGVTEERAVGSLRDYLQKRPKPQTIPLMPGEKKSLDLLGIEVKDAVDRLDGQEVWGVEVLSVQPSGPAALAGVENRRAAGNLVLKSVLFVGMLAVPPVGAGYYFVSDNGIGDHHDLIIGIDAERVHDVDELEVKLQYVHDGDTVYLTVVRAGQRMQVPVSLESAPSK